MHNRNFLELVLCNKYKIINKIWIYPKMANVRVNLIYFVGRIILLYPTFSELERINHWVSMWCMWYHMNEIRSKRGGRQSQRGWGCNEPGALVACECAGNVRAGLQVKACECGKYKVCSTLSLRLRSRVMY